MLRKLATICSIVLLASAATAARAGTLTFETSNGSIYPYGMQVNGTGSKDVVMDCLNDNRTITTGETWNVTEYNLGTLEGDVLNHTGGDTLSTTIDGTSIQDFEEQAFLDNLYNTNFDVKTSSNQNLGIASSTDIQEAIWDIQNTGTLTTLQAQLVTDAMNFITNGQNTVASLSAFDVYVPTTSQWGWTDGQPQEFIQHVPGVTPEPSSLLLMGTGIVGLAAFLRRRSVADGNRNS